MNLVYDIWSVLTARQRRRVLAAHALSIAMAFSTVAGIAAIAPFFALLGDPGRLEESSLLGSLYHLGFSSRRSFTVALGLAFVGLVLFANLINILGSFLMIRLASWISTDLQSALLGEYLHRPYPFHARTPSAVLFKNVMHETAHTTNRLLQSAFSLVTNTVTASFIVVSIMVVNAALGAAMIVFLAGGYLLIYLAVRNRLSRSGEIQSHHFAEKARIVNESLGAIKEILVLRVQSLFRRNFEHSSRSLARAIARTQLIAQSPRHLMECVAVVGLVAVALLPARGAGGIGASLGQLTFFGFAAYRLLPALQLVFVAIVLIRADRAGFTSIAPDLRLARTRRAAVAADPAWRQRPQSEIRLREVSFRYEPERPPAVSSVSLRIPARACVGLVGANGSGKTTLVDLIAGLLVPAAGRIEVDGNAVDDSNRTDWQSRIAYVPQRISLLDTTIAQNVALGVAPDAIDRERLHTAARLSQLDELVTTLPGGYQHMVGERGVRLSGGQQQRIGIARALYTDAAVLILDEATNALDGMTEQELMATLLNLRGSYTVVLIAHRLSAVRTCDLIYELERGAIAASGTYAELIRSSASFRRLASVS